MGVVFRRVLFKQNAAGATDAASVAKADAAYKAPLDELLNNPKTPAEQRGKLANARGQIAFNEKDYAGAIKYYTMRSEERRVGQESRARREAERARRRRERE